MRLRCRGMPERFSGAENKQWFGESCYLVLRDGDQLEGK